MDAVEKKRSFIISVIYYAMLIGLFYLFFKFAFGISLPFMIAGAVALLLHRPAEMISSKIRVRNGFISVVLVVVSFGVVMLALTLVGILIGNELKGFFSFLMGKFSDIPQLVASVESWVLNALTVLPDGAENIVKGSVTEFFNTLLTASPEAPDAGSGFDFSMLATPIQGAWNGVKQIPSMLLAIVITVIASCFMTVDYTRLRTSILGFFPRERAEKIIKTKRVMTSALAKLFKAYTLIILITFCEMFLGLNLLKLIGVYNGGYIAILSFVTALVDILPVLGTGTILIPWAVYLFITGNVPLGIGITIIYAVIWIVRQVIEPKLVAGQVGLPSIVTIIAMYVGAKVFGALGIFLLPLTVIFIKLLADEGVIMTKRHHAREKADGEEAVSGGAAGRR
ncbi:MAG: sporulation integral membrane protein YtvI [Clostridiales bacterium]|nr:sporulation integral membrane protein YtvI [Clostridiales bacterium]